ncbi:condensation domain-containing protein, partial [Methylocucumis oryzae]|uniref:condensation domain-containing protein n=1 Tax=Methylocucumis oryzae TaxID=1632867 RepID=UPI000B140F4E
MPVRSFAASGDVALTPIQAEFFAQASFKRCHWNQSLLVTPRQTLSEHSLRQALAAVLAHHDSLRLRFYYEDGNWRQAYTEYSKDKLSQSLWLRTAQTQADIEAISYAAQRSLDLSTGPLLRVALISVADGSQRLLLVCHHLVIDGVSWRVLLEDLHSAYQHSVQGQTIALPSKTASFKAWAQYLQHYADNEVLTRQLAYWQEALRPDYTHCATDFAVTQASYRTAEVIALSLPIEATQALLTTAPTAYRAHTQELLLAALATTLSRWLQRNAVTIMLEGHGRDSVLSDADIDVSRTVGWFTSLYPLKLTATASLGETIKSVKQGLRSVPDKGLGFGVLRYLAKAEYRQSLAALTLPSISFNYFGQFSEQQTWLSPASESAGADHDPDALLPDWLEINAHVYAGQLQIRWRFSTAQYHLTTVTQLAESYQRELLALLAEHQNGVQTATPSDFPWVDIAQSELDALPLADIADIYPLSPMQQGLLFHTQIAPGADAYINQMSVPVYGLDVARFRQAWQTVLARHEALRSGFSWQERTGTWLQIVYRHVELPLTVLPFTDDSETTQFCAVERTQGFNLAAAPLMRLTLLERGQRDYQLIWTSHHVLLDGWSTSQLLGEVLSSYAGISLPAPIGQYRDYIAWLNRRAACAAQSFWQQRLVGLSPTLLATTVAPSHDTGIASISVRLPEPSFQVIQRFAQTQQVTINTLVQAAWALLLKSYTGQDTVVFGATLSGRNAELAGMEQMIGLFINTLPIISTPKSSQSAAEFVLSLQNENLVLRDYEHTPLADVQRWAGHAGTALFDTLLVFENFPLSQALSTVETDLQIGIPQHVDNTHYPLTLGIHIDTTLAVSSADSVPAASLAVDFSYAKSCFSAEQIQQIADTWLQILLKLVTHPEQALGLDYKPIQPAMPFNPGDVTLIVPAIFSQAQQTPGNIAVHVNDEVISYAELVDWSLTIADELAGLGLKPGSVVALCLPRGAVMIAAQLAVL